MNLLQQLLALLNLAFVFNDSPVPKEVLDQFDDRTIKYSGGEYKDEVFHYRLLKPAKVEAGKQYPVVLFLHGAGERGDDNIKQLLYLPQWMTDAARREKFPCYLIAPQCRKDQKWANVDWSSDRAVAGPEMSDQMKVALMALDEVTKEFPVDRRRVYLTGLSMGGYGSWDVAVRFPERFAAVAPVCGGGDEAQAAKLKNMPIWNWHGSVDKAVKVERSRRMIEAIRAAGGSPKYTELEGVGHNSWTAAYKDTDQLIEWMFEQKTAK